MYIPVSAGRKAEYCSIVHRGDVYAVNAEAFSMIFEPHAPTLDAVKLPSVPEVASVATAIPMEITFAMYIYTNLRLFIRPLVDHGQSK